MVPKKLTIASRQSPLALTQVDEALALIKPLLPHDTEYEILRCSTPGDQDQNISLTHPDVLDDFFTQSIDDALLEGKADLSIHSAKDLPEHSRPGLHLAAFLPARDIRDTLVLRKDWPEGQTPKVIGTSSPRRIEQVAKLYPDAELAHIRGTIQGRIEQLDQGQFDAVIIAACALERLNLSDRISAYLPYNPAPQQGRLAIVTHSEQTELNDLLAQLDVRRKAGLVALVGCPAETAFLSERARQYLQHADVVFHDRLIPDELLLSIQGKAVPVGKAGGFKSTGQSEIHRLMLHEAEQGKLVARLHGGDPCIFGHLAEELEFLTNWDLRVNVVSSPSAAQIASSHAFTPLTHRGDGGAVTFCTAFKEKGIPAELPGPENGNLAVYMGVGSKESIQAQLLEKGWEPETPVVIGERLGHRDERIFQTTLGALPEEEMESPAVFLIGGRPFPTPGWTLFVGTNPENFLVHGPILHWPLIKLVSRPLEERRALISEHLDNIDGMIFPSRHAVRAVVEALMAEQDTRLLSGKKLLAVGPATAEELARFGLRADAGADNYGGVKALAEKIQNRFPGTYLYPCSDASPTGDRIAAVAELGITLKPACFYMNRKMAFKEYPKRPVSRVLFTSTTCVDYYFELYPEELKADRTWLVVGPSTRRALEQRGLKAQEL